MKGKRASKKADANTPVKKSIRLKKARIAKQNAKEMR